MVKQPGKNASAEELAQYYQEQKLKNLSRQFVSLGQELRQHRNPTGRAAKAPELPADGSCCHRTVLGRAVNAPVAHERLP